MTLRRVVVLALLLLLVLACGTCWLRSDPPASPDPPPRSPASAGSVSTVAEVADTSRPRRHTSDPGANETAPVADVVSASDPVEDAVEERREVVVLGPDERPVPGVVLRPSPGSYESIQITDLDGRASFPVTGPRDPAVRCRMAGRAPLSLKEPVTTIRANGLIPVDVRFVDLETGLPLAVIVPAAGPLAPFGDEVLQVSGMTLDHTPMRRGHYCEIGLNVRPPPGYAGAIGAGSDGPMIYGTRVSRLAERVELTVPFPREMEVTVIVADAKGQAVTGATVTCRVAHSPVWRLSATTDRAGRAEVRGVPHLRGHVLEVFAGHAEEQFLGHRTRFITRAETAVTVDFGAEPAVEPSIKIGGGAGSALRGRKGSRTKPQTGTGSVRVRVLRRDGRPHPGADVLVTGAGRQRVPTDASGTVILGQLPDGEFVIRARAYGFFTERVTITLDAGESAAVDLHEIEGRTATVQLVDTEGVPMPGVDVGAVVLGVGAHIEMRHGTQISPVLTDAEGRAEFHGLPEGEIDIITRLAMGDIVHHVTGPGPYVVTMPAR